MVTHFSRATLSSESASSPIVTCVKLEMSAVLDFNCRSISVHNNVTRKILAKFLVMSLEEVLPLNELAKITS